MRFLLGATLLISTLSFAETPQFDPENWRVGAANQTTADSWFQLMTLLDVMHDDFREMGYSESVMNSILRLTTFRVADSDKAREEAVNYLEDPCIVGTGEILDSPVCQRSMIAAYFMMRMAFHDVAAASAQNVWGKLSDEQYADFLGDIYKELHKPK